MLGCRERESILENMVRIGEALLHVAAVKLEMRADVGAFHRLDLGEVGEAGFRDANRLVDQSCAGLQSFVDIQNRRQLFVFDVDQT